MPAFAVEGQTHLLSPKVGGWEMAQLSRLVPVVTNSSILGRFRRRQEKGQSLTSPPSRTTSEELAMALATPG